MSHPAQTLRDKVWSVLNNVWAGDSEEDLYIKTDAILDLVREALLSDEAVTAGSMGRWKNPEAFRFENYAHRDGWNGDTRKTIIAALDAVTGEGGER